MPIGHFPNRSLMLRVDCRYPLQVFLMLIQIRWPILLQALFLHAYTYVRTIGTALQRATTIFEMTSGLKSS